MKFPSIEFQAERRAELYAAHREAHRASFSEDGVWIGRFKRDGVTHSREWLWHAIPFLAGSSADVQIGNTLVAATSNLANHFNSITAVQILLHYEEQLNEEARSHLYLLIHDGFAESVDFSLGVYGVNNFSAMRALFFAACAELLDTYEVPYRHKSIPEVYNRFRIRQFARNVLRLLNAQLERTQLTEEFNTTNYSPLTMMAMASIVRWSKDDQTVELAARIERRVWEELFSFYHPGLGAQCGPHSRANMRDTVAHVTNWKVMWSLLGFDGDHRVQDLIYPPMEGEVIIPDGDVPGYQCEICWLLRTDYHVPRDLLPGISSRSYPYDFQGTYEWNGQGYMRKDGTVVPNVEGEWRAAAGSGVATCHQERNFGIGSMSDSHASKGSVCSITYRHHEGNEPLGTVRTATLNMIVGKPPDFIANEYGEQCFPSHMGNQGFFRMSQDGTRVTGIAHAHHSGIYGRDKEEVGEISFCLFVAEQLPLNSPVEAIRFNGSEIAVSPFEARSRTGTFEITDGFVQIELVVRCAEEVKFVVDRHSGFLRCAAILYEGSLGNLDYRSAEQYGVEFELSAGQTASQP